MEIRGCRWRFEDRTFENILAEMMETIPDGLDTSEGSLIYNACAKQAVRLEEAYMILAGLEANMYIDTADLEHLIRAGNDRGCYINPATYAEFRVQFNCEVDPGTQFSCDEYNYTVLIEVDAEQHIYEAVCDTPGSEPNTILGELDPIEYFDGFEWGKIISCIKLGTDMEETESYRSRLMASFDYRGFGGNRDYYKERINEMSGVNGCKIERVKAPSDYINITIIGNEYRAPSQDVITAVQTAVDPIENSGEGAGIAPIGHRVTIKAVEETIINITTTITYDSGYDYEDLQSYIEQAIDDYLLELRKTWRDTDTIVVRILQIESRLLDVTGIIDVSGTTINGAESNLQITDGSVPVKGVVVCS